MMYLFSEELNYNLHVDEVISLHTEKESEQFKKKERELIAALASDPPDTERLKQLAISPEGLLTDELRRLAWPKLINIDVDNILPKPGMYIYIYFGF